MTTALETAIEAAWEDRASLSADTKGEARDAIETAIGGLDNGTFRVASKAGNGDWVVVKRHPLQYCGRDYDPASASA